MRTIFIGDIHGCASELERLLQKIAFRPQRDRLLLTGDAFTKGPDPANVWDQIRHAGAEMVLGNHDARLIEHLSNPSSASKADHRRVLEALLPVAPDLLPWLKTLPLWIEEDAFLLVHAGINPKKGLQGTSRDEFLAIRTWPPQGGIEGKRWHDFYRPDRNLLVFGHDAPGGLVIKSRENNTHYLIGLDSGCVYGNRLTAYILEEGRLEQVRSLQPRTFRP